MRISDWSSDVCSSDLLGKIGPTPAGGGFPHGFALVDVVQSEQGLTPANTVASVRQNARDGRGQPRLHREGLRGRHQSRHIEQFRRRAPTKGRAAHPVGARYTKEKYGEEEDCT